MAIALARLLANWREPRLSFVRLRPSLPHLHHLVDALVSGRL
jgi:hypothetical protein